jgi:poly(3-hydroxybutyrate) depolymerase
VLIFVFSGIFASIAPVSGTPKLGFGTLPSIPVSLIDFHGIEDFTQPYDLEHSQGMPHLLLYFCYFGRYFFSELVFCLTLIQAAL